MRWLWSEGGSLLLVAVRIAVIEPAETVLFVPNPEPPSGGCHDTSWDGGRVTSVGPARRRTERRDACLPPPGDCR